MAEILVALSGGVDSTVAAALLVQEGHDVTGVTLKLWGGQTDSGCCSVSDVEDARRVAQQLGIDHHVFNFGDDFDRFVVDPYVADYAAGKIPNPCIECNRHIKFDKLFRRADALGFDLIATGHHARVIESDGELHIGRGADPSKDQSYVLHMLAQDQLRRLRLPVGVLTKDRVRELASELGLRTASKPDSQDVCFIERTSGRGEEGRRVFLGQRIPLRPATIVDQLGKTVGAAPSVELVTVGQRKGLDLGGAPDRRYVIAIDHEAAVVTVGSFEETLTGSTAVPDLVWTAGPVEGEFVVQCSAHGSRKLATLDTDGTTVLWKEPHQRVAVGQSVVLYLDDEVVAGGTAG